VTVKAENDPPTAWDDSATTTEGVPVTVNVISNDTDDIGINTASVAIVTSPVTGTAISKGDGTVMYTPAGGFTGVDTFAYTVADTQGAVSNTAAVAVTVNAGGGGSPRTCNLRTRRPIPLPRVPQMFQYPIGQFPCISKMIGRTMTG